MKLALRNWLAERCLEGLRSAADPVVPALEAFARGADEAGLAASLAGDERAALLTEGSPFEATPAGVRLHPDLRADLPALCDRAARIARAMRAFHARTATAEEDDTDLALAAAAALFNAGLYFETHEVLEPPWKAADEPLRTFLQGIIQVAAGLHHRSQGNLRGAESLLREGMARLHPFSPAAYGVEVKELLRGVDAALRSLGEAVSDSPRLVVAER